MIRWACAFGLALFAPAAVAQQVTAAVGGEVRVLDKQNGDTVDITLENGQPRQIGLLLVTMKECRYPAGNPNGDAYAHLTVTYRSLPEPTFSGWMIASAPALNAMDHPRYDVWVLRCST